MNSRSKILILMLISVLFLTSGCKPKVKEQLTLVSNELYSDPKNPSDAQTAAFNTVSELIASGSEQELVKAVAISFAFDFFSFKNKDSESDIGGISYFPPKKQQLTKDYVAFYYYKNYPSIVNQYGADSLPMVKQVVAVNPVATMFEDKDLKELNAYSVRLALTYEDTKLPESALKTDTVITLVKYEGAWRVVAID